MPCSIASTLGESDEVALVVWYKDDQAAPIYTVDARGVGDLNGARQTSSGGLKGRANFIIKARDWEVVASGETEMFGSAAHLRLDPVREADEGEYRCRVDFKRAQSINTVVNLRVIGELKVLKE